MMDRNKRLAELLGICWHEWEWKEIRRYYERSPPDGEEIEKIVNGFVCRICREVESAKKPNPDFTADPRLVLREMKRILSDKDFQAFLDHLEGSGDGCYINKPGYVRVDYMTDQTGQLRDRAGEWLENR